MTSLRGPDPYAAAEAALARLSARPAAAMRELCRMLHETVPTYTWVGLVRVATTGGRLLAQHGATRRETALTAGCAALLADTATLVIHDLLAAAAYRACFPAARALIAVPLEPGLVLVITSAHQGAFGLADRDLLAMIARRWAETTTKSARE